MIVETHAYAFNSYTFALQIHAKIYILPSR